nr:hypothetical protein [Actinomycetota bacterium]
MILHTLGPRLQWPQRSPRDPTSQRWAALATQVVRRPWWVIAVSTLLLLAMTAPVLTLRLGTPTVLALVVIVTFVLLARALRSLWLPIKALALNVLSIGAAYGLTVLIWQHGYGTEAIFGLSATGVLITWVPVAVFAFLFGLS